MDPMLVLQLIDNYNRNPQRYTDEEAELIAMLSKQMGASFKREDKSIRKGLFDLIDTAVLGAIPNTLRPRSRGESVYGETGMERFTSGAGSLLGLAGGLIGGYGAARGIIGSGVPQRAGRGIYNMGRDAVGRMTPSLDGLLMRTRGY